MEREGKYDPKRIPSSVFTRNDSWSPSDWSVASNESLFSIHVGNPSFGREPSFAPGEELGNSGKLFLLYPTHLATKAKTSVAEVDDEGNNCVEKPIMVHGTQEDMEKTFPVDQDEKTSSPEAAVVHTSGVSCNSCDSEASTSSFAFPILEPAPNASNDDIEPHLGARNSGVKSKPSTAKRCWGCFSCFSCFSCCIFPSCSSCHSCFSCLKSGSCLSSSSCCPRCCCC